MKPLVSAFAFLTLFPGLLAAEQLLPRFSWERVPRFGFVSLQPDESLSDDQIKYLASLPVVVLCRHRRPDNPENTVPAEAARIKAINPSALVLDYWNAVVAVRGAEEYGEFSRHPEWKLKLSDEENFLARKVETFDVAVPAMRQWWVRSALKRMEKPQIDGVFADAICKYGMTGNVRFTEAVSPTRAAELSAGLLTMVRQLKQEAGDRKLIIVNGLRGDKSLWSHEGMLYLDEADGAMVEHFGAYSSRLENGQINKDRMAADIDLIARAGRNGKIVLVKGWPDGVTWQKPEFKRIADRDQFQRDHLDFSLAAFLIAAENHCYFHYSYGYLSGHGVFSSDPNFQKRLGAPKGPYRRNGWKYERTFEHAEVSLDLETETASIHWS